MVTLEQAKEYLQSQGITIPDFMLQALVDDVNSIQECLDAHYPASKALAIQMYLLALMGLGQGDKYISSQTGPNGASRSFRYQSFPDRWKGRWHCCASPINTAALMTSSLQTRPIQLLLAYGLPGVDACVAGFGNGVDIG